MLKIKTEATHLSRRQVLLSVAGCLTAIGDPALAQGYPAKPVRWIVPYAAGGATDIVARLVGEAIGNAMGQRVLIDNKPGASATVGTQQVASALPDGYTLGSADNSTLFNNWHLFDKLPYTPSNFEYVAMLGTFPLILATSDPVPAKTLQEWQQWVKQRPGKTSFATPGIGTPHHIAMAALTQRLGLSVNNIPYRGDSAAAVDLIGGNVQSTFMGVATARQYIGDKRLKFLAITWPTRIPGLPDIPTMTEAGLDNFDFKAEQGVIAPAGTPKEIVRRLNGEINNALQNPAIREKLEGLGMYPVIRTPEEFKSYVAVQANAAGGIIKSQGIKLE